MLNSPRLRIGQQVAWCFWVFGLAVSLAAPNPAQAEESISALGLLASTIEYSERQRHSADICMTVHVKNSQAYDVLLRRPAEKSSAAMKSEDTTEPSDIVSSSLTKRVRWAFNGGRAIYESQIVDASDKERIGEHVRFAYDGMHSYAHDVSQKKGSKLVGPLDEACWPEEAWLTLTSMWKRQWSDYLRSPGLTYIGRDVLNGIDCIRVSSDSEFETINTWISPSYAFRVIRRESIPKPRKNGGMKSIVEAGAFREYDGEWFPSRGKQTLYHISETGKETWLASKEWELVSYNSRPPDDVFRLAFPVGTRVTDKTGEKFHTYTVDENGSGSTDALAEETLEPVVDCGVASLTNMLRLANADVNSEGLESVVSKGRPPASSSMLELRNRASDLGLDLVGMKCDLEELRRFNVPAIAHVKNDHFLVVERITDSYVRVFDGPFRPQLMRCKSFEDIFTGHALLPAEVLKSSDLHLPVWADSYIVDLGEIEGTSASCKFVLHTSSSSPVSVLDTSFPTGATVTPTGVWEIRPDQPNKLSMAFNVPKPFPGRHEKFGYNIRLATNIPKWPVIYLTVIGTVYGPPLASPQVIVFGDIPQGGKVRKEMQIVNLRPAQEKSLELLANDKLLKFEKREYDKSTETLKMSVVLDTSTLRGPITEPVTARWQAKDKEDSRAFSVTANVVTPIRVSPSALVMGLVREGTKTYGKVKLSAGDQREFSIKQIKGPAGVKATEKKDGNGYLIEVSVGPDVPFSILDNYLTVVTDHPKDRIVRIPIFVAREPSN